MLETAWESRWLPDPLRRKRALMSVSYRTDIFQWAKIKARPVGFARTERMC